MDKGNIENLVKTAPGWTQIAPPVEPTIPTSEPLLRHEENLRLLTHYDLLEQIGKGGMGSVWRARLQGRPREVAVKFLPENDAMQAARFEREEKITALLHHPGIMEFIDYGLMNMDNVINPGTAKGRVKIIRNPAEFDGVSEGDVIVTSLSAKELEPVLGKAAAIITETPGILNYPTNGKPAILGVENATKNVSDGQIITVNSGECAAYEEKVVEERVEYAEHKSKIETHIERKILLQRNEPKRCYVAEYIRGKPLSALLEEEHAKPVPNRAELERIFLAITGAMAYAHSQGVIHRDLKPANIVLGEFGEVKVIDWGLGKRVDDDSLEAIQKDLVLQYWNPNLTLTRELFGTPAYMAPEQAAQNQKLVGKHSDVWSLGAILYEMLTGQRPFEADNIGELLDEIKHTECVPPSKRAPGKKIPHGLEGICMKALAKKPEERFNDAGEMLTEVRAYMEGMHASVFQKGAETKVHDGKLRDAANSYDDILLSREEDIKELRQKISSASQTEARELKSQLLALELLVVEDMLAKANECAISRGDGEMAGPAYRNARKRYEEVENEFNIVHKLLDARTEIGMGSAFRYENNLEEACRHYHLAETKLLVLNDKARIANVFRNLSVIYQDRYSRENMGTFLQKLANNTSRVFEYLSGTGRQKFLKKAFFYAYELQKVAGETPISLFQLGFLHFLKNRKKMAEQFMKKAEEASRRNTDKETLAGTLNFLGKLKLKNEPLAAINYALEAYKVSVESENEKRLPEAALILARAYVKLQNFEDASRYYEICLTHSKGLIRPRPIEEEVREEIRGKFGGYVRQHKERVLYEILKKEK